MRFLDVVFTSPPGGPEELAVFVEVEDEFIEVEGEHGRSVRIGAWDRAR